MPLIALYLTLLFIAPQLWIPPFVGMRVDLVLYPAWLLWVLATGRGRELVRFGPMDWFFVALIAWTLVTTVVNGFHLRSAYILVNYAKWFLLFRLVVASLPSLPHVKRTCMLVLFFGLVLAVEGIHQVMSDSGAGWAGQGFAWMDERAEAAGLRGRTRWINIFDGPGVFCVVYTIAIPFALQYVMKPFGAGMRLVGLAMLALLLLATYYTGSRGGFLATLGVFGLFALIRWRVSIGRMVMIGLAGLLVLAVAPSHLTSTSDSHRSAQHRIDMWGEGIEMTQQNPVFGIGRGRYAQYTGKLIAHNSALEIMGESGLPGIFIWMGLMYLGYKSVRAAWLQTSDPILRSYLVALALSVAGYLLSALFVTLEYETLYFLLALAAAAGATAGVPLTFGRRDAMIVAAAVVAFFVVIKSTVMIYY